MCKNIKNFLFFYEKPIKFSSRQSRINSIFKNIDKKYYKSYILFNNINKKFYNLCIYDYF